MKQSGFYRKGFYPLCLQFGYREGLNWSVHLSPHSPSSHVLLWSDTKTQFISLFKEQLWKPQQVHVVVISSSVLHQEISATVTDRIQRPEKKKKKHKTRVRLNMSRPYFQNKFVKNKSTLLSSPTVPGIENNGHASSQRSSSSFRIAWTFLEHTHTVYFSSLFMCEHDV